MADNETTATAPVTPAPVAEAPIVEHRQSTVDPDAVQKAMNIEANTDPEPEPEAPPTAGEGKSDEIFKPFGDIQITP